MSSGCRLSAGCQLNSEFWMSAEFWMSTATRVLSAVKSIVPSAVCLLDIMWLLFCGATCGLQEM